MRKRDKVAVTIAVPVLAARCYAEGYRREPESAAEVRAATAMAVSGLGSERWDAEG